MRKYWRFFILDIQDRITYRGDMIFYALASISFPILAMSLWLVTSGNSSLPYSTFELVVYFVAVFGVGVLTEQWQGWFISEQITDGQFSMHLLKPYSHYYMSMMEKLADVFFKLSVIFIVLLIALFFLPPNLITQINISYFSILLFLISLIIGFLIMFTIEVCIGYSAVWFYEIGFIKRFMDLFYNIFSGKLVPLVFFPAVISSVAIFLPFRYVLSFPIELLLNKLSVTQILEGFAISIFWLVLTLILYNFIKQKLYRNYQGFG